MTENEKKILVYVAGERKGELGFGRQRSFNKKGRLTGSDLKSGGNGVFRRGTSSKIRY